ncbi:hypothetical protein Bbelb_056120 [Branchiostoma belcheri]|nr:hypothetical protein Bbelb_056120 [Branchiostoma belcheri]
MTKAVARHHIGLLGDVCEHLSGTHSPVARSAAVKANERAGLKGIWFPPRGRKGGCHQPAPPAAILSSEFSPSTSAKDRTADVSHFLDGGGAPKRYGDGETGFLEAAQASIHEIWHLLRSRSCTRPSPTTGHSGARTQADNYHHLVSKIRPA